MTAEQIKKELAAKAEPGFAEKVTRFFKTAPGTYGYGDVFIGVRVPEIRKVVKNYRHLPLDQIKTLLLSGIHEERFAALVLMNGRFAAGGAKEDEKRRIYELYMDRRAHVNNWDLVDVSAPHIPGAWLYKRDKAPLYTLSASESLWDRRIAVVSTLFFIRKNRFKETLSLAGMFLDDKEDLIHKAAGWMLREVGKRSPDTEEAFLKTHLHRMPRTMLRYAIERFPQEVRRRYLEA